MEVVRRGKGLCLVGIIVNWLNLLLLLFSPERSYRVFDAFHSSVSEAVGPFSSQHIHADDSAFAVVLPSFIQ